ncbi:uncharacterized protein LOC114862522 isoform X1 [Betta splendens]|uniref:Uncharacterized protein LOC114862522 isoform X1 n=1 Tax=Betta splendens TaxID=158456 RepID=A0A6P7NLC0_BETSP|nr:uncharacterized protein LOC114862522 isoform X1 [Betta splendens]XP_029018783.1 uncharacterized protein LOC114862522 isoform X1 [Betta splendens]XP_040928482.1 uncharacterized protein LOC114862522 isoform X1 [Betta splendens]
MCRSGTLSATDGYKRSVCLNDRCHHKLFDHRSPAPCYSWRGGGGFKQLIHTLKPSCKELPSPFLLEDLLKEQHSKGKMNLAQLLRMKTGNKEKVYDHAAPLEFEPRVRGQPSSHGREVPHFVTLSVDIWFHSGQGNTQRYLTLWAHYIDRNFSFHNLARGTQRLRWSGVRHCSLRLVEAQVKAMAQEWGISQPNLLLFGGEGRKKIRLVPTEKDAEAGCVSPPNSTTFLETEDSPDEPSCWEHVHSNEELQTVPCFFSALQSCIEEVMSHNVISKTLNQFHSFLSSLLHPPAQSKSSYQHLAQSRLQTLTREEQTDLSSWAHSRPT